MKTKQVYVKDKSPLIFFFLLLPLCLNGKETEGIPESTCASSVPELNKAQLFNPLICIEAWAVYSHGESRVETQYADRSDVFIRRFRLGGSGKPYPWLSYNFQFYMDYLGEDKFSSTKGTYNGIDLWNAFVTARLLKNSELLHLHAGYFWAAVSREFNVSPWDLGSLDKTRASWYLRHFITGKGNGIESGLGLGGMKNYDNFGFGYRIGTYEPEAYAGSDYSNRLYTARLMFSFGDAEQKNYNYMLPGNQWRKRKGITVGFGASNERHGQLSDTIYFDHSSTYGADLLIDYKGFRIDSECFAMKRKAGTDTFAGLEWHIRAGYNFEIAGKYIEPVITYHQYSGEGKKHIYKHTGTDNTFDIGLNWYLNKQNLKLALHYVMQSGNASPNAGDYAGLAFQLKL